VFFVCGNVEGDIVLNDVAVAFVAEGDLFVQAVIGEDGGVLGFISSDFSPVLSQNAISDFVSSTSSLALMKSSLLLEVSPT